MAETIEIIIAEALPHLDRTQPPPGYREVTRLTAALDNPRGNEARRVAAARQAAGAWAKERGGRVRSLSPRPTENGATGFLAVVEGAKTAPRGKAVARGGVLAGRSPLARR
jgi:hypothetical protein